LLLQWSGSYARQFEGAMPGVPDQMRRNLVAMLAKARALFDASLK
jgi:hypothetical protein